MTSAFSGLNTMVRGLYTQQIALNTVGHNIANASTDGFSRQQVNMASSMPETIYSGAGELQVGTGVGVTSIVRARDTFVDQQFWKENSTLGYGTTSQDTLGKIEGIFNDDTTVGTGIQTSLNNFWDAWQTLSTNSSNASAQTAVRERGADLVDNIQHAGDQLKSLVTDVNATLTTQVAQINQITSEIYSLNKQISNVEVGGQDNANDLRDTRDNLTDQLSKLANIRVYEDSNHNYNIQISDVTVVNGGGTTPLATQSSIDPQYGFQVNKVIVAGINPPWNVNFTGGEMHALQEANTVQAQAYLDKLSTVSQFLLQEFNAVHRAGYSSDNSTGVNFFGNAGTDYQAAPLASNGDWLDALKVNPDLYDANGLNKIAIKTSATSATTPADATVAVVQSNANGGKGTVLGTYVPPNANYQNFIVQSMAVSAAGHVSQVRYSLDGGTTYTTVNELPAASGNFALAYGLSVNLADNISNVAGATNGDTFRFGVPQGNASGDNATNLANAIKLPTNAATSILQGASLDDYYGSLVANMGIQVQNSKNLTSNEQTLVDQITTWRQSVSGVNIDEEMTNMIKFQKGYSSAARVVTALDEMLDKLINSTGMVGR